MPHNNGSDRRMSPDFSACPTGEMIKCPRASTAERVCPFAVYLAAIFKVVPSWRKVLEMRMLQVSVCVAVQDAIPA